ncbi:uncharacterized protein LOC116158974 [Photinus pyralis]|nr:uncharacterized protein LOC116158974 [Photinus pyralis]
MRLICVNGQQEPFLLFDNGPDTEHRILIFSTQRNLELLERCEHWYADGTFKTTPPLFTQVYTIHGVRFNTCIPSVFVLLPGKSKVLYQEMIQALKGLRPNLKPSTIMIDFERAAIEAFQTEFPEILVRGCFFHLGQCIWRKVQEHGKAVRYANDVEFAVQVKMLTAISFLPLHDVVLGFEELMDTEYYRNEIDLHPICDYFEDVWIGRPHRNIRRPPLFQYNLWNFYDATNNDLPRTNNSVEGWHRRFTELISAQHPSIWRFIAAIKEEQHMNEIAISHYIQGRDGPRQKKKYRDLNIRIKNCVARYDANEKFLYPSKKIEKKEKFV